MDSYFLLTFNSITKTHMEILYYRLAQAYKETYIDYSNTNDNWVNSLLCLAGKGVCRVFTRVLPTRTG